MKVALADIETNGLLNKQGDKTVGTRVHCIGAKLGDQWWASLDDPLAEGVPEFVRNALAAEARGVPCAVDVELPDGNVLKWVRFCANAEMVTKLETEPDLIVGHNWQDFDSRFLRRHMGFKPTARELDTLILWKLLYPSIYKDGPNTHKVPGQLKMRYSLEALGYRLGERKNKDFDPGDWQTFSWAMLTYMMQDVVVLEKAFNFAMRQEPKPLAVQIEHDFAGIMRRQETWGFTFDYEGALQLQSEVALTLADLEGKLIAHFGDWWAPGKVEYPKASRQVKMTAFPDVTEKRYGTKGNELKPYVGPPKCGYEKGCPYTPISRVTFQPGSRDHVRLMLNKLYGWVPTKFTDKGTPQVDDDVLRSLEWPEAQMLADYYAAMKVAGYVSQGKQAWLSVAHEEVDAYRMHGSVNTIGTYTYRCGHMKPNMGQIPTRDPVYGPRCRKLFKFRTHQGFIGIGTDGSGVQLRGLAHYLSRWDGGAYIKVFESGQDPHGFMAATIGEDLMGVLDPNMDHGGPGRVNGKTMNYALCFGGGDERLGSICRPHATQQMKRDIGLEVKRRMLPVFGTAFIDLKEALAEAVMTKRSVTGLDGTIARVSKPHAALATLLQLFEAKLMKLALILHNEELIRRGFRPGVNAAGIADPYNADWEYCANVHDEFQADVRLEKAEEYTEVSYWAVPEAGLRLKVKCPMVADVKRGSTWHETH